MGIVLEEREAERTIGCGASFIVSPVLSPEVIRHCAKADMLCVSGIMTPAEMCHVVKSGAGIMKLLPSSVSGMSFIREIRESFPRARIIPRGGVTVDNAIEWLRAGVCAVADGGSIVSPEKDGNFEEIRIRAERLISAVSGAMS